MTFTGEHVLVLGGTSGIGRAVAALAAERGAAVTVASGRAASVERALAELPTGVRGEVAVELAPLRVNAVSPGMIRSPLWAGLDDAAREQMYEEVGKSLLIGRIGKTREVAEAYLYLMASGFATGSVVTVDGGAVLV